MNTREQILKAYGEVIRDEMAISGFQFATTKRKKEIYLQAIRYKIPFSDLHKIKRVVIGN